jgi:Tol biopolymer transport system component
MKIIIVITLFFLYTASSQQLLYMRGQDLFSFDFKNKSETLISKMPSKYFKTSSDICISKEGAYLFYTKSFPNGKEHWHRHIAKLNLLNKQEVVLKNTPLDNDFGPIWSPNESKLLFHCQFKSTTTNTGGIWRLTITNNSLASYNAISEKLGDKFIGAAHWINENEISILSGDSCFIIDTIGNIIRSEKLPSTTLYGVFDGTFCPNDLTISPDERFIAFIVQVDDDGTDSFEFGPGYQAIFIYNRKTSSLIRVTNKSLSVCSSILWSKDSKEIYFSAWEAYKNKKRKAKYTNIYKLVIENSKVTKLISNAIYPTLSFK